MKALIQKHQGEFANINVLTAYLGFAEKGYCTQFFEYDELDSIVLDDDVIVVGATLGTFGSVLANQIRSNLPKITISGKKSKTNVVTLHHASIGRQRHEQYSFRSR